MPRHYNQTKQYEVDELLRLLKRGPSYSFDIFGGNDEHVQDIKLTAKQRRAIQRYFSYHTDLWLQTWVTPVIKSLLRTRFKVDGVDELKS